MKRVGPPTVWAFLALMLWAGPVLAQGLAAASDGSGSWILSPEPDRPDVFTVLHRAHSDPQTQINKVQTLRGDVRPNCVAARDHTLWIIYPDGGVQAIAAEPSILQDGWVYRTRVEPSLPKGVSVRATGVTATGPWALVRVEEREALEELDAASVLTHSARDAHASKRRRNLAIGLPPRHGIADRDDHTPPDLSPVSQPDARDGTTTPRHDDPPSSEAAPTVDNADADKPASSPLPVDRLLQLEQGRWRVYPLPDDWAHGTQAWLVTESEHAKHPTLVARASGRVTRPSAAFDVYRHNDQEAVHWERQAYTLKAVPDTAGLTFIGVESQLVSAQFKFDAGLLLADLSILRGGKVLPVGRMALRDVSPTHWALLGTGNAASLIARPGGENKAETPAAAHLRFNWTQQDVRGKTVLEQTPLAMKLRGPMDDLMQYLMLAFIAVLVTVLMLAFWRRDASWNRLELPAHLVVADLGRRAIAAAIDMAPGLLGSMFYFGLNFEELMLRWPGNGLAHTLEQVTPGTVVIAVFVTHTTISELFFSRTLGKALTGLRTTALNGARPRGWQLLVRGLLKALDLIPGAWLLLMLPVIAPHRQRLGDLVGRTVVVCDAPKADDNQQDESGQADDD